MIRASAEWLFRKRRRRAYRAVLGKWYADGGDAARRFDYPLTGESLVLDVGGYRGQWASDIYARYRCRILVFEPVRSFATEIVERFRYNDDIEVIPVALGASTREETIHLRGASSSLYRGDAATETIRVVDAAEWLRERDIRRIHLIKINIEGGEYELLERLIETGASSRIDDIQVQFHNVDRSSVARMERIQQSLHATHEPTYQYRFVWENWRRRTPAVGECVTDDRGIAPST